MPTIHCVADDRHLCQVLENSLTRQGYSVLTSNDGEQALRDFEKSRPEVVIMDILLPKRDGFQVLEGIRGPASAAPNTPVLLMSSSRITSQHETRARELGAQALLAKPVPIDRLTKVIRKFVEASIAKSASARSGVQSAPQIVGSLSETSFPHLLHHLHGLRASGVLRLGSGKTKKLIQMRDGYPLSIKSNRVSECLGNQLVRKGVLSQEDFQESVDRMKRGEGLQGQVLVAMEVLEESALTEALRDQALEKIYEIFAWEGGRYQLEEGKDLQRANALSVDGSPANLIVEGVRRNVAAASIEQFFADNSDRRLLPGKSNFYRFQEISFLPVEEEMVARVDGTRTLGDYAKLDDRSRRTLYGLLITEFLHLAERSGPAQAVPRARRPAASKARPIHHTPPAQASSAASTSSASKPAGATYRVPRSQISARQEVHRSRENREPVGVKRNELLRADLTRIATRLKGQNYFEVLGVTPEAGPGAIESGFAQLAKQVHPDRYSTMGDSVRELADEAYALASVAYATLSDPKSRTAYWLELKKSARVEAEEAARQRVLDGEIDFQKGLLQLKARDYPTALAAFGRALEKFSKEGDYHAHYGWCLHLCHPKDSAMAQEAIEHVRRGIKLDKGRNADSFVYLGKLYKAVGRMAAAEKMFTRALQIQSDCVDAIRELRLINLRREKRGILGRLLHR